MSGGAGSTVDEPVDEPIDEPVDEHRRWRPAEPLRPLVAYYSGYRQRGVPPALHRGLPSPFLTLIFTLDEPMVLLAHPDPRQPPGDFGALLGGLHSAPALITHDGAQSGIQVALRPLGSRALLGMPAGELAGLDVRAEAVLGGACAELRARALAAPGWPERFAILDEFLHRRLAATAATATRAATAATPAAPEVRFAWRQLLRTGGTARIADLAAETGWSGRHLTGRFRTEIGLTPKAAARVIRFDRARHLLISKAADSEYRLADLAAACGYFDQAHLAREFRALAGCPPSRWIAEEFRNIQAGAWLFEGA
jgi:AraC-like DNA-binding protein